MPLPISSSILNYLNNTDVLYISRLYLLLRRDGRIYTLTDCELPITCNILLPFDIDQTSLEGVRKMFTFNPEGSFDAKAYASENRLSVQNSDLTSYFTLTGINAEDLFAGKFHNAKMAVYAFFHDLAPSDLNGSSAEYVLQLARGDIGEFVELGANEFKLEFRGLGQKAQQKIGLSVQEYCPWSFRDFRCQANAIDVEATVIPVFSNSRRSLTLELTGPFQNNNSDLYASDRYRYGKLQFLNDISNNGRLSNVQSDIASNSSPGQYQLTVSLYYPLPFNPTPGMTVKLSPGCDKTIATCHNIWRNSSNYGGFPYLPGKDRLLAGKG